MHYRWCVVALFQLSVLAATLGCGGVDYKVAPVSGVVKLDGAPLAGASVSFVPESSEAVNVNGAGSYGRTDEAGRYTLKLIENDRLGAAIGRHKISISASQGDDPTKEGGVVTDRVPERYRGSTSTLTFEVPPGGTKEANFDLTTASPGGA